MDWVSRRIPRQYGDTCHIGAHTGVRRTMRDMFKFAKVVLARRADESRSGSRLSYVAPLYNVNRELFSGY
jgi:hypothetical protein